MPVQAVVFLAVFLRAELNSVVRTEAEQLARHPHVARPERPCAADMVEASTQFPRVNGHLHLAALRGSLERHDVSAA